MRVCDQAIVVRVRELGMINVKRISHIDADDARSRRPGRARLFRSAPVAPGPPATAEGVAGGHAAELLGFRLGGLFRVISEHLLVSRMGQLDQRKLSRPMSAP